MRVNGAVHVTDSGLVVVGANVTGQAVAGRALVGTGPGAAAWTAIPQIVAITPAGGIGLINGTQNLLQYTTPNDGRQHLIVVSAVANITVAETGGTVVINYTVGGTNGQPQLLAGNTAPQLLAANQNAFMADPNTTVTIIQSTALTAGAATFFGAILAQ